MKKYLFILLFGLVCVIGFLGITNANKVRQGYYKYVLITDKVDVELESSEVEPIKLVPENRLDYKVDVFNKGIDAWIRLKIEPIEIIENLNEDLIFCDDGYYYLEYPIKKGEVFEIFSKLYFKEDFLELHFSKKFDINVKVEGIQFENFKQDLHSPSPWGDNVQIEVFDEMLLGGDSDA